MYSVFSLGTSLIRTYNKWKLLSDMRLWFMVVTLKLFDIILMDKIVSINCFGLKLRFCSRIKNQNINFFCRICDVYPFKLRLIFLFVHQIYRNLSFSFTMKNLRRTKYVETVLGQGCWKWDVREKEQFVYFENTPVTKLSHNIGSRLIANRLKTLSENKSHRKSNWFMCLTIESILNRSASKRFLFSLLLYFFLRIFLFHFIIWIAVMWINACLHRHSLLALDGLKFEIFGSERKNSEFS